MTGSAVALPNSARDTAQAIAEEVQKRHRLLLARGQGRLQDGLGLGTGLRAVAPPHLPVDNGHL